MIINVAHYIACVMIMCVVAYGTYVVNEVSTRLMLLCGYLPEDVERATITAIVFGVWVFIEFCFWNILTGHMMMAVFEAYLSVVLMVFGLLYRRAARSSLA